MNYFMLCVRGVSLQNQNARSVVRNGAALTVHGLNKGKKNSCAFAQEFFVLSVSA